MERASVRERMRVFEEVTYERLTVWGGRNVWEGLRDIILLEECVTRSEL